NAIRHGIAPRPEPGRLEIRARRHQETLQLQVCDDGPGLVPGTYLSSKGGVGLSNTRARLQQLYRNGQQLKTSNGPGRGLLVTVTIPFRTQAGNGAAPQAEDGDDHPRPDRG